MEVNIISLSKQNPSRESKVDENRSNESATTLLDVLKAICRENKYDENDATVWLESLKSK